MNHWSWAEGMRAQLNLRRLLTEQRSPKLPITPKPGGHVFTLTPEVLAAWVTSPEGRAMKEENERKSREEIQQAYDELDRKAAMHDTVSAPRNGGARNLTLVKNRIDDARDVQSS